MRGALHTLNSSGVMVWLFDILDAADPQASLSLQAFSMHGAHSGPAGFRHLQPNPGNH